MDVPQEVGAKILPFRKKDKLRVMTDEKEEMVTTSFTIPKRLNDMLRQDGIRCHRTTVKQLVAILDAVYFRRDVQLHGTENYQPVIEALEQPKKKAA